MLCVNKLTNLVFKNQENSAKPKLLPFSFLLFLFGKDKQKQPRMKCMNVMQCKSQKKRKKKKPKNNAHKEQSNEAQGLCQKD